MCRLIFFSTQSWMKLKHSTGVSYRKVVHPAPQDRIDQFDHPTHRLGAEASEDLPEFSQ